MKFQIIAVFSLFACLMVHGKSLDTFIINGQNTATVPFYAYLEIFRQNDFTGPSMYFGGGSLITNSLVLTVAQNVVGFQSWRVGMGSNIITSMTWRISTQVILHEGYSPRYLTDNIAVIRLAEPFTLVSGSIGVVPILGSASIFPQEGNIVQAVGFGFSNIQQQPEVLQIIQLSVVSQQMCQFEYPHLFNTGHTANHFCGRNDMTRSKICAGDQGGPVYDTSIFPVLVGIQSFYRRSDCADPLSQPGAFIRISQYAGWVDSIVQMNHDNDDSHSIQMNMSTI